MADRIQDLDDEAPGQRIRKLVDMYRNAEVGAAEGSKDDGQEESPFKDAAKALQLAAKFRGKDWSTAKTQGLMKKIIKAMARANQEARNADARNTYGAEEQVQQVRQQFSSMVRALNPPPEISESAEFLELLEILKPPGEQRQKSAFQRNSGLKGGVRGEVMLQQVAEAVRQASRDSGKKLSIKMDLSPNMQQFASMTLEQMARQLQRLRRKRKKNKGAATVDEDGNIIESGESGDDAIDEVAAAEALAESRDLQQMMELFSAKALHTMRNIREEIAPKWAPDQQPWLVNQADRQVYDILLAAVPEELFQETASWEAIQDLRAGDALFTLRAADRTTDAARRG